MKKEELKILLAETERQRAEASLKASKADVEIRKLKEELKTIRENWRPVPITHEWVPRNAQCVYCDDPRDSVRHQVGQVRVSWVPQLPGLDFAALPHHEEE